MQKCQSGFRSGLCKTALVPRLFPAAPLFPRRTIRPANYSPGELFARGIRVLAVDPGRRDPACLVRHQPFGLHALLAELVGGLDGKQLRLTLGLVRSEFLTAEHDEPDVL